jgi:hypothetical protein
MFISKVFVLFFSLLLVSSVIGAPVLTERSLDEVELLPRAGGGMSKKAASAFKKITSFLRPKPGKAVFWSGMFKKKGGGDVSVKRKAENFAKSQGKETIGHALHRQNIRIPGNDPHTNQLWDHASHTFAKHASGETHAVLGPKMREGNVYERIEKPTLLKNDKVTKLTEHNPETGGSSVVKRRK